MLTAAPETQSCWRAARPCAMAESQTNDDVSCWAWYRCEEGGDYVIKWRCNADPALSENGSTISLCSDQSSLSSGFSNCPPPIVCADDPKQRAPIIVPEPGYLSTDLILVIAVVSFAVIAVLLTIGSSYKYWSLRRKFRFPIRPGRYVMREFPHPVRYHNNWGTRYSLSNPTSDTTKRPPSSLSGDLHTLFPELNKSRLNLMNVNGLRSHSHHPDTASRSFVYPDVYISKHSSETVAVPRPRPTFPPSHGHSVKPAGGSRKDHSSGASVRAQESVPSGPFGVPGNVDQDGTIKRDSTEAAGSFVYHDPWGGGNPLWRFAGQANMEGSCITKNGGKERQMIGGGGVKKGILDFSYISSGAERNRNERIETRIRKVRSDRMGEWWFQRKSRLGHAPYAGYPQSESSEERIHIYRGNLTKAGCSHTKHSTPKKNTGIYSSVSRHTFGEALGSLRHANIANPSHAVPPDARVSSIDIPYHDTLSQDMPAGKNDIHFSRTEVYPPRENRRQVPSTPNSPVTFSPGHSNNIYSQLIALSGGINPSRAGSSIDKHHEGDGKVYLSCRFGAKSNDSFAKRDKFKTKKIEGNTKRQKTRRRGNNIKGRSPHKNNTQYLRVGEAVYRIVPNATHGNSSNSSSSDNSLGSAASATYSKPGMAHAYRMSDLDLSYDNFRDDHLRQLARHGRGVASSSTLDACTPPLCIRAGMAGMAGVTGVDSEHSSSSMGRDRIRF